MSPNRDASGTVTPLPKPSIDTGAGLERLAAVLQGKISNFDTDLFAPLIERAGELTGTDPGASARGDASLRIVADHARASTFLISDGVTPSNEGRGYVLRKILRRGIRHARLLGATEPLMAEMCRVVHVEMRGAYSELDDSIDRVSKIVFSEETRFAHTLAIGLKKLEEIINQRQAVGTGGRAEEYLRQESSRVPGEMRIGKAFIQSLVGDQALRSLSGLDAFKLTDTFGLPLDFIVDALRDRGMELDQDGYDEAMAEQRTRARASWKGGHKDVANPVYAKLKETFRTEPDFYYGSSAKDC